MRKGKSVTVENYVPNHTMSFGKNDGWKKRTLISVATEGWVSYQWALKRFSQIIPVNWEASGYDIQYTALGYCIDDAYNMITKQALALNVEWLIIIEDDVILPPDCFLKLLKWQLKGTYPVVSGVYYTKASPAEPLVFRGRGNGAYRNWKPGDLVMCDGLPMGCLMIHTSLLRWMSDNNAQTYNAIDGTPLKRVFETPQRLFFDPETGGIGSQCGTQDLYFFDRLIKNKVFEKTGWKKIAKMEYPLLCDTSIFCQHQCRQTGRIYP